jgi:hypothetical protein
MVVASCGLNSRIEAKSAVSATTFCKLFDLVELIQARFHAFIGTLWMFAAGRPDGCPF